MGSNVFPSCYHQVAVNGSHLLEYKHKIPVNRVDTFSVSGDVRVHAIGFIPNSVSASCKPRPWPQTPPTLTASLFLGRV